MEKNVNVNNQDTPNETETFVLSRKKIAIRLLNTILYSVALGITLAIINICIIFQYVHLFATLRYSDSVRMFSNKVSTYAYKILRFLTLCENQHPFPFSDLPVEIDKPVDEVTF